MDTILNKHTQFGLLQKFEYVKTPVMAGITHMGEAIALRPCVENLGLNWSGQLQAIQRNEKINELCVKVKAIAEDGKMRQMVCLPPVLFQDWLWSLNPKSENFNTTVWEDYKKGLVMYLLMMLKMSLDELQKTAQIKEAFSELSKLTNSIKELEGKISENQEEGKRLKSENKITKDDR